jgi:NAD(P)-dependent dehydrogenase (short-subunit alcohol dehydrogenase family)
MNLGFSDDIQSNFWQISPEVWNKVMSVNLGEPFFMSRAVIGHFIIRDGGA